MSLRTWLRDRRLPVAIVLVALAAGTAQLLLWWMGPPPKTNDFVGPPRSGYTLSNAKVTKYGTEGLPGFRITAPHVERREGDESLYINSPSFELPSKQPGVPDWRGQSLYGWVDKAGTLLKLQGPVHMHRDAYPGTAAADIHTSDVTAWPKDNRMETAAPAQMVQGALTMSGVGMRANLNDKHLELLDDSHGSFPPRKRRP
ncbi:LPS export ABC transporter periplasmic protein LptC [Frateuria sp. Soil773]|uniref:LPS export ABC transporter periplasmic protein LptC n=1 Tax=Frateuria sp. Soil773 TaxID=1736407 RepID=UPI00070180CB|nr:LPS export ABC transporter periplasmic protein LptC [Frateuria sp. Soil773]KRE90778.1 LPS export ABC transporter periplasmic protein LptC [Frateuria sp. Soil773]